MAQPLLSAAEMSQFSADPRHALPASVRKQILVARMAMERVEFVQAVEQFKQQARPGHMLRLALGSTRLGTTSPVGALLGALRFTRNHPYLGSLLGSAGSLLLRKRMAGALFSRLLKVGLASVALYGAIKLLRKESATDRR